ncbi:hypothetical protein Hypma_013480 [Hypsizygus marmoreus]|uniref:Uncharacterized protein n=1 Tax=Hypsizygus marmoreus TaxID=39966 RepID=A0A369JI58_HYPMA|nr:hypothetical protein Hypma_013480 [Hypsizygus marmoreus]
MWVLGVAETPKWQGGIANGKWKAYAGRETSERNEPVADTRDKTVHRHPNDSKPRNTTFLAFNMLAKCAESRETHAARIQRADIYLLMMTGTRQMLIERPEIKKLVMAQITLVHASVPGGVRSGVGDLFNDVAASNKTRGINDKVVRVVSANFLVKSGASET